MTARCGAQEQERAVSQQRSAREAEQERQWKQLQQMRQQQTQQQQQIIHDQRLQGSATSRLDTGFGETTKYRYFVALYKFLSECFIFFNVIRLFWYLKIIF